MVGTVVAVTPRAIHLVHAFSPLPRAGEIEYGVSGQIVDAFDEAALIGGVNDREEEFRSGLKIEGVVFDEAFERFAHGYHTRVWLCCAHGSTTDNRRVQFRQHDEIALCESNAVGGVRRREDEDGERMLVLHGIERRKGFAGFTRVRRCVGVNRMPHDIEVEDRA